MKIGYPCINRSLNCSGSKTFRLKSYSEQRFRDTVENNLSCLLQMLKYNVEHGILFFRISSDVIPFASHPICSVFWQEEFVSTFQQIGSFIKTNDIRISMHPDQFIVLNAKDTAIVQRSIKELEYHAELLDALGLDDSAKIQLHLGGVYGDKTASLNRFITVYDSLPKKIKNRLVIENDHNRYHLSDCLNVSQQCHIPILFDYFHYLIYHQRNEFDDLFSRYLQTWSSRDGIPMCDYSSQRPNHSPGSHAHRIDIEDFRHFLEQTTPYDIDIMLEIKDKEHSALQAIDVAQYDTRFVKVS